jgi:hypothetical protein
VEKRGIAKGVNIKPVLKKKCIETEETGCNM